jgi:hypothetical protein
MFSSFDGPSSVLFVWAYQPNLSAIQQCFSLRINQPVVLSAMAYRLKKINF